MDTEEKVRVLAAAARFDASCASGGAERDVVFQSWTDDGRRVALLKVLYSNVCRFDCAYCVNRASNPCVRASFTTTELVDLTAGLYRRGAIEGLFLSSGVFADPDIVMERLIDTARTLRADAGFAGYLHLKIIPGATERVIREAGRWADRLSINIELPTDKSLQNLAPSKSGKVIMGAMNDVAGIAAEREEDRRRIRSTPAFAPDGQTTQLIIGASDEDDRRIVTLAGALYRRFGLRRVYYSAFRPVGLPGGGGIPDPRLPGITGPPIAREHRLYQADWLLRFYHFRVDEILEGPEARFLDTRLDPKTAWALRHLDFFPVDVNRADYDTLLRVPGIGAASGRRVVEARRGHRIDPDRLRRLGVVMKRARYFVTANGAGAGFLERLDDPDRLRRILADGDAGLQLPLFEF